MAAACFHTFGKDAKTDGVPYCLNADDAERLLHDYERMSDSMINHESSFVEELYEVCLRPPSSRNP